MSNYMCISLMMMHSKLHTLYGYCMRRQEVALNLVKWVSGQLSRFLFGNADVILGTTSCRIIKHPSPAKRPLKLIIWRAPPSYFLPLKIKPRWVLMGKIEPILHCPDETRYRWVHLETRQHNRGLVATIMARPAVMIGPGGFSWP